MALISDEFTKEIIEQLVIDANKYPFVSEKQRLFARQEYKKYIRPRVYKECNSIDKMCFCGAEADCIHHVRPLSRGGSNDYSNLIFICNECHAQVHKWLKDKSLDKIKDERDFREQSRQYELRQKFESDRIELIKRENRCQ